MKKPSLSPLFLALFSLVFALSPEAFSAERVKVRRVKGLNAIIESTTPLEEGQTYRLVPDSIVEDVDYKSSVLKPRDNSLTLGSRFSFLKADASETTQFDLQVRYGWNFSSFEVGALLNADSIDSGAGATTTILAGAYVDYNFIANRDPRKVIYGPTVLVGFGSTQFPSSTTGGSATTMTLNGGAFVSYFIGDSTTALRGELFGVYSQVNTSAAQNSVTGLGGRALLVFYF